MGMQFSKTSQISPTQTLYKACRPSDAAKGWACAVHLASASPLLHTERGLRPDRPQSPHTQASAAATLQVLTERTDSLPGRSAAWPPRPLRVAFQPSVRRPVLTCPAPAPGLHCGRWMLTETAPFPHRNCWGPLTPMAMAPWMLGS